MNRGCYLSEKDIVNTIVSNKKREYDIFMTVREVAKYLRLSKHTIKDYSDKGRIPFEYDKNGWRYFKKEDIDKFLETAIV